jgi:putative endonuclease
MKPLGIHNYFVYITTNYTKQCLYTGVTNNLLRRLFEHSEDAKKNRAHFTGRYKCIYLIFWERFDCIEDAIASEKQIKGWLRRKKEDLISAFNPNWKFLNEDI